jgi:signal peptidase I
VPLKSDHGLRAYAQTLLLAVALVVLVRSLLLQAFVIPSPSMLPILEAGDYVLINKLRYGIRLPLVGGWLLRYAEAQPGDVIVFAHPAESQKDLVKRVIAVHGETLEIRDRRIYVNGSEREIGSPFFEEVIAGSERNRRFDNYGPVVVPPKRLFVMGENRDNSDDSRMWGFVKSNDVIGKAFAICWSWDERNRWVRWGRIGALIY